MNRTMPTAPAEERARTLATLAAAGVTTPPRMRPGWHSASGVASLEGWVESLTTRRQMLDAMTPEARARRLEQIEAFPEDLDAPDRQPVSLAYLVPDAAEKDLGQWVDRQYATGRIAAGYALVSVKVPRGGRPAVGPQVNIAISPDMLAQVDAAASTAGVSRSEWVRRAVSNSLRR